MCLSSSPLPQVPAKVMKRREAPCQGIPLVCKSWHTPWRMNPSSVLSDHALTAGDVRGTSVRTTASPASGSRRRAGTQGSGLHTAQCVRLGTRCATIADGSPGRHRRRTSEASSAATEHANDDNTETRGSDATERAATIEVMTTPSFDAATHEIAVGPCRLRCMKNEHGMLCNMQEEIERRFRVPVSLKQLLQKYEHTRCDAGWSPTIQGKSWSGIIEAISRCIAAFQKATDAAEHIQCQDIATKTCDYAIALARKTPAYCGQDDVLALLHQFMQNRTYNLAFIHLLNRALCQHEDDDPFWSLVRDSSTVCGSQKENCLQIIEVCVDAIQNDADHLLRQMEFYRL